MRWLPALCLALCAIAAPAASRTPAPEPSIVIVEALKTWDRSDLTANDSNGQPCGCVTEGQFKILRRISGPYLGFRPRILFPLQSYPQGKLYALMTVKRQDNGLLWAGGTWLALRERLCLDDATIAENGLERAFKGAERRRDGERCLY